MSKLCASTFFCAFSIAALIQRCSIGSPSSIPSRLHEALELARRRRCAAGRPRARGRSARCRDRPGVPNGRAAGCRCGATRGARCRGCAGRPPRAPARARPAIWARYFSSAAWNLSDRRDRACRPRPRAMNSGLPPSTMSVPRPAMLVEIVTRPRRPAWATISASRSWCLAFRTWCVMPVFLSSVGDALGLLDRDGADQDRLPALVAAPGSPRSPRRTSRRSVL